VTYSIILSAKRQILQGIEALNLGSTWAILFQLALVLAKYII